MLHQAQTEAAKKQETRGAVGVAIAFGLVAAIYIPFYLRAKKRGDLGGTVQGTFCERQIVAKSRFAKESFRYKKSGAAWVLIGCPKRRWDARVARCRVGMRAYKVLAPAPSGRCSTDTKRITK